MDGPGDVLLAAAAGFGAEVALITATRTMSFTELDEASDTTVSAAHTGVVQILLAVCWGVFIAVWIVAALVDRRTAPLVERRSGWWWGTSAVAAAGYLLVLWLVPRRVWALLTVHAAWLVAIGAVLVVVSLAFTLWARMRLGVMWNAAPSIKAGHELRTDGPYAWVRHPIYTGLLGMLLGTVLMVGLGPTVVVLLLAVAALAQKIRIEERLLSERFIDAYPAYRAAVPALVPWRKALRWTGSGGAH